MSERHLLDSFLLIDMLQVQINVFKSKSNLAICYKIRSNLFLFSSDLSANHFISGISLICSQVLDHFRL